MGILNLQYVFSTYVRCGTHGTSTPVVIESLLTRSTSEAASDLAGSMRWCARVFREARHDRVFLFKFLRE